MCHDMLHMRGGHQTSWLIDGVSIPSTNIAANVGPQIAPGDTDQIEVQRGSYAADIGDRTYGVFNIAPRNGFERDHEAELQIAGGDRDTGEITLSRRGSRAEDRVVCQWVCCAIQLWVGDACAGNRSRRE